LPCRVGVLIAGSRQNETFLLSKGKPERTTAYENRSLQLYCYVLRNRIVRKRLIKNAVTVMSRNIWYITAKFQVAIRLSGEKS